MSLQPGINARMFPADWRPLRNEIAFSRRIGAQSIQLFARARQGDDIALTAAHLGDSFTTLAGMLTDAGLIPTLEIAIAVDGQGQTSAARRPTAVLDACLPAIEALSIYHVHWHITPDWRVPREQFDQEQLGAILHEALAAGCAIAEQHGFKLSLEHNAPNIPLLSTPAEFERLLDAHPALGFVWDINHTAAAHAAGFRALLPRATLLHISDTPLPELNWHLPLGQGSVDVAACCRAALAAGFAGPAILEIGGAPWSGGFGQDTDAALADSMARLQPFTAA